MAAVPGSQIPSSPIRCDTHTHAAAALARRQHFCGDSTTEANILVAFVKKPRDVIHSCRRSAGSTSPRAFFHSRHFPSLSLCSPLRCSDHARIPRPNARPAPSSLRLNTMAMIMAMTMSASQSEPNAESARTLRRRPPNRRRWLRQRHPRTCTQFYDTLTLMREFSSSPFDNSKL
jgi:hypothetical protein